MPSTLQLLKTSRPRFWIYTFGPYLVGCAAAWRAGAQASAWELLLFGFYFLIPANLLIYGVNDIYDYETDVLNDKKAAYESIVRPSERRSVWIAIVLTNLPFVLALSLYPQVVFIPAMAFLLLGVFYSAPPVRAKTKPFLDSAFNILYIMPGVFAYVLSTDQAPSFVLIAAAGLWTAAMHAYSAIPDIDADRKAGIATIATLAGARGTLVICLACFLTAAILAWPSLGVVAGLLGAAYVSLMIASLFLRSRGGLFDMYKRFPALNAAAGFILFWAVVLTGH